jgi:hypothetical protein
MRSISFSVTALLALLSSAALAQQPSGTKGETIGHPPPLPGPPSNSEPSSTTQAAPTDFHASGKQPGAQRLHRGICARRYSANPILHRSIAEGGRWSKPGRSGPRRLHKKSESDPMQHSR